MHVVLHSLAGCFGRRLEERPHVHVKTAVGITRCHYLGATVVAVLSHLCHEDTRAAALLPGKFLRQPACQLEVIVVLAF